MPEKVFILKDDESSSIQTPTSVDLEKYRKDLNAEQLQAVMHTQGPLLVVAGAGTGKTKTLTYRVSYLIEKGISPSSILLLTFTRRAAEEMMNRAVMIGGAQCSKISGGTFHAYAHKELRIFGKEIGIADNFTILDQADTEETLDIVRTSLGFHKKEKRFPKKGTLQAIISSSKNRGMSIEDVILENYPQFASFSKEIIALSESFHQYKQTNGLLDYDDLLTHFKRLLEEKPHVRQRISSGLKYIMVDEYQDTNTLQAEIVRYLSEVHGNIMAVGDDAQSIYSFRGANFRNILEFPEIFPGTKIIKLEENYRSTPEILAITNFIINQAKEKYTKQLFTRKESRADLPALVHAPDERHQSRFIAQRVLELREEGIPLSNIAVLMRNSRDSFDLELELKKRNIPFQKFGGQKLVEAAHIKDFISYLKLVYNPRDVIAWNRILQLLEGIGPKTAQDLINWIKQAPNPYRFEESGVTPKYLEALRKLGKMLIHLKDEINKDNSIPLSILGKLILEYYLPILREKYFEDFQKREKDLENFNGILIGYTSIQTLISDLALDPVDFSAIDTKESRKDESPMTLSTIHSAKGLEWHTVFLINAIDGILPSRYAVNDPKQLDEELRLLYVALTRAKQNLSILYPIIQSSGYEEYFSNPSRFLKNIPKELYDVIRLIDQPKSSVGMLPKPPEQRLLD
ncbi:MAG: ATP-dependent helicase [Chloroherpetonaceae bacterium]|nr:ATP-dependent helicase [Chloroherpetonaceae bacterium]